MSYFSNHNLGDSPPQNQSNLSNDSMDTEEDSLAFSAKSKITSINITKSHYSKPFFGEVATAIAQSQPTEKTISLASSRSITALQTHNFNDIDIVTEEFVTKYNARIGDTKKKQYARNLIQKMRQLGGLEPLQANQEIDLPAARLGLAILTGVDTQEVKVAALHSLQTMLKNDPLSVESAEGLVQLMVNILKKMDRSIQQTQTFPLQIEFATTYGAIAELILRHYAKKHINGISQELKEQLTESAIALKYLNRHNDPCLSYHIKFALEGILRLKDDNLQLIKLLGKCYHLIMAGTAAYLEDAQQLAKEIDLAFKDINYNPKHAWYDMTVLLRRMGELALKDKESLLELLKTIKSHRKLGWNFLYEAQEILTTIAIHGENQEIRTTALSGTLLLNKKLPGLHDFAQFNKYKWRINFKPMLHLELPEIKNSNLFIRINCLRNLMKIANSAPDKSLRVEAKRKLLQCLKWEQSPVVKEQFDHFIYVDKTMPADPYQRKLWAEEKKGFSIAFKKHGKGQNDNPTDKAMAPHTITKKDHAIGNLLASSKGKEKAEAPIIKPIEKVFFNEVKEREFNILQQIQTISSESLQVPSLDPLG